MSRWAVLALVTAAFAASALAALAVAPLAPFLLEALALSRAQVGFLLPAVYLGGVVMSLPSGWLVDRLGVRWTLALGQTLTGAMVALAGASPGLPLVLACLLVGGFGFSVVNPATGRAVIDAFPPRERGLAMGVKQTGLTLGGIGAALLLPPVALALGWRRAFVVAGGLCLATAGLVALAYRRPPGAREAVRGESLRVGDVGVFLRRRGVLVVFGCGLALSVAQASVLAYLVLYARETFALSPVAAGRFLALAQAGGTASRLGWGYVSDRFFGGRRRPGVVITALVGAATYVVFALGAPVPPLLLLPLGLIAGVGAFGWVGLCLALAAEIGGTGYAGLLTGVAVMFAWSGVLIGPVLFGLVLDAAGTYAPAWLGLSAISVAAAVALGRLRPLVRRES